MVRIVVVGNCQTRPLASLLSQMCPDVQVQGMAIVHLLRPEEEHKYAAIFGEADFIVAQKVADGFPCPYVRTSELRHKYGDKVITWINLYYSGYTPELTYYRLPSRAHLSGPLGDYHIQTFIDAWKQGSSLDECIAVYGDESYHEKTYAHVPAQSLAELLQREQDVDLRMVEFIADRLSCQRLFFTFNHPATILLIELARRVLAKLELPVAYDLDPLYVGESLNQFIPPVNPYTARAIGITFPRIATFKGLDFAISDNASITLGKSRLYTAAELATAFYRLYDAVQKFHPGLRDSAMG